MRATVVSLCVLACLARPVAAEGVPTAAGAADAATTAFKAGDAEALAALAGAEFPDPDAWIVADVLLARGERAVAEALAKAVGGPDTGRLGAYVAAAKAKEPEADLRAALAEAEAARAAGEADRALARLADAKPFAGTVLAVLCEHERGRALETAGRHEDASRAYEAAATAAEEMGWLAEASQACVDAGRAAYGREFPRALAAWEKGRALFERRGKPDGVAGMLANLSLAHKAGGDWQKALESAREALRIRREIGDAETIAVSTKQLGALHQDRGDLGKALAAYEETLEIQRQGGLDRDAAGTQVAIGGLLLRRGEFPKAREVLQGALETFRAAEDSAGVGAALQTLAAVAFALGNSAKALDLYGQARKIWEAAALRQNVVETLVGTGQVHRARGDVPKAIETHQEALALAVKTGYAAGEGMALQEAAYDHLVLGNYPKALGLATRAERVFERIQDRARLANALATIAQVHRLLGRYPEAAEHLERARRLLEKTGDRVSLAAVREGSANLAFSLGDYRSALEGQRAAAEEYAALGIPGAEAITHTNLGAIHDAKKDHGAAVGEYRKALGILEDVGDRLSLARTLVSLAEAYRGVKEPEKALDLLDRSKRLHAEMKDRVGEIWADLVLAACRRAMGEPRQALDDSERAEEKADRLSANDLLVEALIAKAQARLDLKEPQAALDAVMRAVPYAEGLAHGQGEEQGASARAKFADLYDVGARAAAELSNEKAVARFLESGRAGTLLESLGGRDLLQTVSVSEDQRAAEAAARGNEHAAFRAYMDAVEVGAQDPIKARRAELDAARAALSQSMATSQREAKSAAGVLQTKPALLDEMQGWLAPEEALVLYSLPSGEALAVVVTADEARIVRLGPTAAIEEACEQMHASDREKDAGPGIAALRRLAWAPLGLEEKATRVLVSPDGALAYAPLSLLAGGSTVTYVPSGTTYGTLREEEKERAKPGQGVLGVGDPVYGAPPGSASGAIAPESPIAAAYERGGVRLVPLPGTRDEVTAVATVPLLGKDATEAGFRMAVRDRERWRAVHFACHGLVDPENPTLSSLALTPEGQDDGFLRGLEVAAIPVHADLAVLSGCETGKGRMFRGEGMVGLVRAFMLAGSSRVLVSLWRVDDEATRALMTTFYERWKSGVPTAQALREAQESVKAQEKWRHPYFWAAWVLWGLPN